MKKKPVFSQNGKSKGQSLVEMALFLMILLWLLAGAVDFGIAYFSYTIIRDAAQEGVVYGCINPPAVGTTTSGPIVDRVRNSAPANNAPVDLDTVTVEVTTPDGATDPQDRIKVTVIYNYPLTVPLLSIITGPTIQLKAEAEGVILAHP